MESNDALFYTSLYTFLGGFLLSLAGLAFKSKCKHIKCCGMCEIERDVEAEVQEHGLDLQEREHNRQSVDRPLPPI